jgi:hypothetical protein
MVSKHCSAFYQKEHPLLFSLVLDDCYKIAYDNEALKGVMNYAKEFSGGVS